MKLSMGRRSSGAQRGMTLIEVMVGLVIGMVGMLVIFQTMSVWNARTRATTAGSDSQVTGSIAMFSIERDLRLAAQGFGTAEPGVMGCTVYGYDSQAGGNIKFPLTPVVIVDHSATNEPDELATLHGTSAFFTDSVKFTRNTSSTIGTFDRSGFKPGDLAVLASNESAVPGSANCGMFEVTDSSSLADKKSMSFVVGNYDNYYTALNVPTRYNAVTGVDAASNPSGWAFNLGPRPRRNVWTVDVPTGVLGAKDELNSALGSIAAAEGVIDLKAEYGYDIDPAPATVTLNWGKTLPAPGDWTQVRAVRVAILVRSRNYEKPDPNQNYTAVNPVWHKDGGATEVPFLMKNADGTNDSFTAGDASANNWRNYRYTVYEKVFPLRNVIWGQ